jgi:hypothetical protein
MLRSDVIGAKLNCWKLWHVARHQTITRWKKWIEMIETAVTSRKQPCEKFGIVKLVKMSHEAA